MPKVSIIIPIFNAELYLRRCLDSLCNQTLRDIEIICINDCSNDDSGQILQEYSKYHKNIIIKNLQSNQGESAARNAGLALAQGEYLAFVDNDDEVDLDFYEKLYEQAIQQNADIAKGQVIEIAYNGGRHVVKQLRKNSDKFLFISYWWTAIYKRSVIVENNISFSVVHPLGGDLLFLNKAVIATKNFCLVEGVYYHYHRREDSGDGKILSEKKIKSALDIFEMIINNTNASAVISRASSNFIFHHFIIGCIHLSLKTQEKHLKQLCATIAVKIFNKCRNRDFLRINFATTAPNLFAALRSNDNKAIEEIFVGCKSRMEIIASGLRARIKNHQ